MESIQTGFGNNFDSELAIDNRISSLQLPMPARPTALRFAIHTGPIPFTSRSLLARVESSAHLSPHTRWDGLSSLALRPFSGPQLPQMSFVCLHQSSLRTKPNQRHRCYSSNKSAPITDPSRSDLFYHVLSPPTPLSPSLPVFGLSFISKPPPSADSSAIIGWLPAASEGEGQEAGLNDFKENRESISTSSISFLFIYSHTLRGHSSLWWNFLIFGMYSNLYFFTLAKFRILLHEAIQGGLRDDVDDIQRNGALQLQSGWMHINGILLTFRPTSDH
jgi:hypothetical protein